MRSKHFHQSLRLFVPAVFFGTVTGVATALVITAYKWCAKHCVHWSEAAYTFLRTHSYGVIAAFAVLFGLAVVLVRIYKKAPNLRGGGIPTSIGILRGLISFRWLRNLVGTFMLSLTSFLVGVPLGTEGPSVQMGTAVGRGSVFAFSKKHRAWDRYSMTGGACAGFSVATGAPISGIMFAIEETHQRISPMIVIVAVTSVISSMFTAEVLSPLCGVNVKLFPDADILTLTLKDIWLPFLIGLLVGLFAVLFLKLYQMLSRFFGKRLATVKPQYKIFGVFAVTVLVGLFSFSFISTGHELILELFHSSPAFWMLILLLIVRTFLTLSANCNNLTGGIFLPILAIGTVAASLLGKAAETFLGLGHEYYALILVLGITACIAGMMKSPLTAVFFAVEALSCYNNLLYVILTAAVAFIITEMFAAESINDSVLEHRMRRMQREHPPVIKDTYVTVQDGAFAIGKQVRDIFWPANLFVLSVRHAEEREAQLDRHGGNTLNTGDILHIRYSTYNVDQTLQDLYAIVGEREDTL